MTALYGRSTAMGKVHRVLLISGRREFACDSRLPVLSDDLAREQVTCARCLRYLATIEPMPRQCDCENGRCQLGHMAERGQCPNDASVETLFSVICAPCAAYMHPDFLVSPAGAAALAVLGCGEAGCAGSCLYCEPAAEAARVAQDAEWAGERVVNVGVALVLAGDERLKRLGLLTDPS